MRALVALCLRLRFIVALGAVAFLIVGWNAARSAPVDVFPEFAPPRVEIQTEAPGLSAIEVETLVTTPLERAVHGVAFLSALRSKSVLGLSSVVVVFQDGTDLMKARQLVQERMSAVASQLPAGAKAPVMLSPLSSTSRVMKIGLSSRKLSQIDLTDLARATIRPRLMAVPGVANVAIWGQRDRQLQVKVNPETLQARGIRLDDVLRSVRDATTPAAAGYVDTPAQRFAVTHAPFGTTSAALGELVVLGRAGTTLRLSDVATIEEGHPIPIGDAIVNDAPGLLLIVEKQPWGNTLDVTRNVESALEALRPALSDVSIDPTIFRPATFIERALENLGHAIAIGCLLVAIILFLFLYDWRTALISVVAIPLSLVAAATILAWRGVTLDTMTIAGLVIALGEVVDDAIIDVENIQRRLALNASQPAPRSAFLVVLDASLEVRSAVVYATLIVVLVFVPVYFMDGLSGAFFRPLAIAYVLAVGASLVVALTITPALSLMLLPKGSRREKHGPLSRLLRNAYRSIAVRIVTRSRAACAIFATAIAVAAALVPFLGEGFLPNFHETDFLMHWVSRPGTSIEEMDRITMRASKELRAIPGVRNFGSHIGRAEVADEVVGPNFAELWISLDEKADYEKSVAKIQATIDGYPGIYRDVQTYLQERMKEVLTGAGGSIVVRIYGPDLASLRAKADEVGNVLKNIPGIANLKVEPQVLVPQIEVALDPAALQRFALTPGDARRPLGTLIQGTRVGEVYRGDQVIDVVVIGDSALRTDISSIRDLRLPLPMTGPTTPTSTGSIPSDVRLADLASVSIVATPNIVQRDSASRRIDVTCDARGRDLGAVAKDVERTVRTVTFPSGHHAEVLGEYAARSKAQTRLFALACLSLLGIAFILYADFRSARTAAFVMATLPFALVGGVVSVVVTGGVVSLGSLVGFVTVLGIAARNAIMLVSHFRHLELEEKIAFGEALIVRGSVERVVPIVMTALATGLALVPILLSGGKPGSEIEHPMAVVIVGGLITSTALNLLLVPALYLRFGRTAAERDGEDGEDSETGNVPTAPLPLPSA